MQSNEQRKHIRFFPDPMQIAIFDVKEQSFDNFQKSDPRMEPDFTALIENESHTGASLVIVVKDRNPPWLYQGKFCIVQLEKLPPMKAEIKWIEWVGERIVRIGITVLE